jgi:hypothetical protein
LIAGYNIHVFRYTRRKNQIGILMSRSIYQAFLALTVLAPIGTFALGQESVAHEILITYRCRPADRPAFRNFLATQESHMLNEQKAHGMLRGYQILFNPVVTETFDALLILHLNGSDAVERWLELERSSPGGLSPAGLRLATPLMTYFADLQWEDQNPSPPGERSVFYAIPYNYNSLDQYKSYVDAYVIPQVQGWMREGILSHYAIYLNRYNVGPPWDALFIYEYRDLKAFGERELTIAKIRDTLRSNSTWQHWSDIKTTVRTESENTILKEISPLRSAHTAPRYSDVRSKETPPAVHP